MPWNGSEVASVQLSGSLIRRWHRLVYHAKLNYFECKFAFRSEEMAEKIPCCARSRERERDRQSGRRIARENVYDFLA